MAARQISHIFVFVRDAWNRIAGRDLAKQRQSKGGSARNRDNSPLSLSARSQKRGRGGSFGSVAPPGVPTMPRSTLRLPSAGVRFKSSQSDTTFLPHISLSIYPRQLALRPDQTLPVAPARESAYVAERELRPATCETCGACSLEMIIIQGIQ